MYKFFLGVIAGIGLITIVLSFKPNQNLGAVASNGDFIGIYNATPTDMALVDGFGSALLVDSHGRLIATSTNP